MARANQAVDGPPVDPRTAGALVRLATEDWSEMTAAATASPNHVSGMARWRKIARDSNPHVNDEQLERLAAMLRRDHYQRIGRLAAQARKLAREAQAELERGGAA